MVGFAKSLTKPILLWLSLGGAVLLALLLGLALLSWPASSPASAQVLGSQKAGTCGAFSVTVGGRTFTGKQTVTIPASQVGQSEIFVDGTFIEFFVNPSTFAVRDYRHTGVLTNRPDKNLDINGRTQIFASKVPQHGDTLNSALSLSLSNEGVVLERSGSFQDMKIQAKDCHQGGLFQMEPEPGTIEVNTLGPNFVYTGQPPGEERLCFTNQRFSGYDSPQFATLISFTEKVARWNVTGQGDIGGRIGMVIGEDAIEGGCNP